MIRTDVQQYGNLRIKRLNRVQLKTADFQDDSLGLGAFIHIRNQRGADITPCKNRKPGTFKHPAGQFGGGGFTIGPGNGNDRLCNKTGGKLKLTGQRYPAGQCPPDGCNGMGHPGTDHDLVCRFKRNGVVGAQFQANAQRTKLQGGFGQVFLRGHIRHSDFSALPGRKTGRCKTGPAQTHHQYFLI